jgi:hypothetical protein
LDEPHDYLTDNKKGQKNEAKIAYRLLPEATGLDPPVAGAGYN